MKHGILLSFLACCAVGAQAQELLVPVASMPASTTHAVMRKTVDTAALTLPFFDDFADYENAPDPARWQTDDALVNKDFGLLPPTVGVVTLDALDANGALHANAGTSTFGGDTLTSRRLRLDSAFSPQGRRLLPSDSLYLSFFYTPGGGYGDLWARIGDVPEAGDSLILELYNAATQRWQGVWGCDGISADTLLAHTGSAWQWVAVPITDPAFFSATFQFRFRNLCSMSATGKTGMAANCDQWNLDYIRLAEGRTRSDSTARDIAFVVKAPSMLQHYQAMPVKQFAAAEMATNVEMTITNLYGQTLATHYAYTVTDPQGRQVANYDGGSENALSYWQNYEYQTATAHAEPPVNFLYNLTGSGRQAFTVTHVVSEGFSGDAFPTNDTVRFLQVFDNYYAYDDGVPENGYGLTSSGSRIEMAVRFALNVPDTLTALDLYFNATRNDENVGTGFRLTVWADDGGQPGELLYEEEQPRYVRADSIGCFVRYRLATPVVLPAGICYVGFRQSTRQYINIGFDRSRTISGQNFYRTGNEWQQSILNGAVLLRPCFGARATVGIAEAEAGTLRCTAYPNPVDYMLHIALPAAVQAGDCRIQLYDGQGRCRYDGPWQATLEVRSLPAGLYVLRVCHIPSGRSNVQKITIQ